MDLLNNNSVSLALLSLTRNATALAGQLKPNMFFYFMISYFILVTVEAEMVSEIIA